MTYDRFGAALAVGDIVRRESSAVLGEILAIDGARVTVRYPRATSRCLADRLVRQAYLKD